MSDYMIRTKAATSASAKGVCDGKSSPFPLLLPSPSMKQMKNFSLFVLFPSCDLTANSLFRKCYSSQTLSLPSSLHTAERGTAKSAAQTSLAGAEMYT